MIYNNTNYVTTCDGKWHGVNILKNNQRLAMKLDDVAETIVRSAKPTTATVLTGLDIESALYIGGIKPGSKAEHFIKKFDIPIQGSFGGCIRGLSVSYNPYDIGMNTEEGVAYNLDGCPSSTVLPGEVETCKASLEAHVYKGTDLETDDTGLRTFTPALTDGLTAGRPDGRTAGRPDGRPDGRAGGGRAGGRAGGGRTACDLVL
ncbi:hypothetical protein NP493_644g03009 [Ridgeia piscesae]|uniref:Laminin G domain-containing protein n=1 Tax=Ridgeia piscesae TaxID=27915 RepID=A0AAD9KTZ7_RIDPI|nr:hypothetical protein NP493_644g03009 [Ridgeia piscesae]